MYFNIIIIIIILTIIILIISRYWYYCYCLIENNTPFENIWKEPYISINENILNYIKNIIEEIIPINETLLGVIKYNDRIPWEGDVSFCVSKKNYDVIKKKIKKKYGIIIYKNSFKIYDRKNHYSHAKFPFIIIYYYIITIQNNSKIITISNDQSWNYNDFFPLSMTKFRNIYVSIPKNYNYILEKKYGTNWYNICSSSSFNYILNKPYSKIYYVNQEDLTNNIENIFNNVWVINLDRRQDRWKKTKERLNNIGIKNINRWRAEDVNNIKKSKNIGERITINELACLKSHLYLWKYLVKNCIDCAIIFEDDIVIGESINKNDISKEIKKNIGFNILFLGYCKTNNSSKLSSRIGSALCLHAYVITKPTMRRLIKITEQYLNNDNIPPIDLITRDYCKNNLCFLSHNIKTTDDDNYFGEGMIYQDENLSSDLI